MQLILSDIALFFILVLYYVGLFCSVIFKTQWHILSFMSTKNYSSHESEVYLSIQFISDIAHNFNVTILSAKLFLSIKLSIFFLVISKH